MEKNEDFIVHDPFCEFCNFGTESAIHRSSHQRRSIKKLVRRAVSVFAKFYLAPDSALHSAPYSKIHKIK